MSGNKSVLKKIRKLLDELIKHPYTGTGQPEQLKHNLTGFWSRRINRDIELFMLLTKKWIVVTIISTKGHYN
ncbi:Txe/YoeB family addiction module toxin [Dyadobacter psychrotolerans]|uniref:Txe/YoeB family addiction module toxin n=1 Tax=Dyadobacter psychrotolerans TaxID=2541721 RepID=UPI001E44DA45|nr:Txe/YoeB family addiction module toxin [Dyadobacter psychrotolerans]